MTPLELRDKLKIALADQLGTYVNPKNNYTEPAIIIGNRNNQYKVTGLEVVLPWFPDVPKSLWSAGDIYREEHWNLYLILHSGNKLSEAVDILYRICPQSRGVYLPQNDIVGSLPQYRFTLIHKDLYNGIQF